MYDPGPNTIKLVGQERGVHIAVDPAIIMVRTRGISSIPDSSLMPTAIGKIKSTPAFADNAFDAREDNRKSAPIYA